MLAEALAGRSAVDGGWWAELADLATEVIVDLDGIVQGVLATAVRPRDGPGVLLWCHGREDPAIVSALVGRAIERLADRPMLHAFDFASALSLGLEALPVRHRASTARALREAGFTGRDLWRYAHRTLPAPEVPADAAAVVTSCQDPVGWRIERRDDGQLVGEVLVTTPVQRIGLLSWISVEPAARGHGLARPLLGRALEVLSDHGAREVILYVDDDELGGERDRTAANRLYDTSGCTEVDRLHSYTRPAG
ncbi:MAG: GNAT family N-acetyltransferase [Pseudonocardiaceae bacterium]|nr:GNAT family N-acetyltransferase [Pseudonocardiaceae bacterium]